MNAIQEFDQQNSQVVNDNQGLKRKKTDYSLKASMQFTQTLLPDSQEEQEVEEKKAILVFSNATKKVFCEKIVKKTTKSTYLARFYKVDGFTLETSFKIVQVNQEGKTVDRLIRHGPQIWRNATKQIVRQRNFENGKLHGKDTIFCYTVKLMHVVGGEPAEMLRVYVDQEVCSRNFERGVLQGVQICNEFHLHNDKESKFVYYVAGSARMTTNYRNGLKHGVETRSRISDGKLFYTANYINGQKDGIEQVFTSSKLVSSWSFRNGKRVSGQSFYRNTSQIKCQISADGNRSTVTVFDKQGSVLLQTNYNSEHKKDGKQQLLIAGQPQTWMWSVGLRIDPPMSNANHSHANKRNKIIEIID